MKKKSFLFVCLLAVLFFSFQAFADEENVIRVGLEYKYKSCASVPISNKDIILGFAEGNSFSNQGEISSSSGFIAKSENRAYIKVDSDFKSFTEAKSFCSNKIYGQFLPYPVLKGKDVYSVYIGPFNSSDEAKRYMQASEFRGSVINCSNKAVGVYIGAELTLIADSQNNFQIKEINSNEITLGERTYRGRIEFINNSGTLTAVNVIGLEEYLYSTVGSEMPATWHKEALKAQAVACRNYSYFKRNTHIQSNYDVCDSTHCQVYNGTQGETASIIDAVNSTKGIMAYYDNEVINAVYSSSNGGYSADSKSVWNYDCDYLKAVEDLNEEGGKVWARSFTYTELAKLAGNIGTVTGVSIESDSVSSRVNKLIIKGTSGEKILERENIRTFFSSTAGGSLESRNFVISQGDVVISNSSNANVNQNNKPISVQTKDGIDSVNGTVSVITSGTTTSVDLSSVTVMDENYNKSTLNTNTKATEEATTVTVVKNSSDTVVFSGKGWGHGVGMSQFGAKSLAEKGYTYDKILKYYYSGINLK